MQNVANGTFALKSSKHKLDFYQTGLAGSAKVARRTRQRKTAFELICIDKLASLRWQFYFVQSACCAQLRHRLCRFLPFIFARP